MTDGHPANANAADRNNGNGNGSVNDSGVNEDFASEEWAPSLANLSTPLLNSKLSFLQSQSSTLSSTLTAKLASSPSGQSLLHIGPSLSTLPPDLHSLLASLQPMLEQVREFELHQQKELMRIVTSGKLIQRECRRASHAEDCTRVLKDLVAVELILEDDKKKKDHMWSQSQNNGSQEDDGYGYGYSAKHTSSLGGAADGDANTDGVQKENEEADVNVNVNVNVANTNTNMTMEESIFQQELDHMASLERVAHATLHLTHQLQSSSEQVTTALLGNSKNGKNNGNSSGNGNGNTSSSEQNQENSSSKPKELQLPSMNIPLPQDTEKAQFIMKLAPRIRALEKNAIKSIGDHLERVLKRRLKARAAKERQDADADADANTNDGDVSKGQTQVQNQEEERLLMGHLLRSFALLGRGSDAESMFANVAIMPIVKKKVSIGKLDEGGSRGECAGLFQLLQEIVTDVKDLWGDVLQLVESIFDTHMDYSDVVDDGDMMDADKDREGKPMQIDLVTAGVWVPIATALMTDPSIKMAIFSPGIANIFQANYSALDTFLADLASSLLKSSSSSNQSNDVNASSVSNINASAFASDEDKLALTQLYYQPEIDARMIIMAQSRIYAHSTTLEFSKKWNLPIYYQLRFGEVCARIEKTIQSIQEDGWHAPVYTGDDWGVNVFKEKYGFEIPFFLELFDALRWMWGSDVFLRPLTHRFLRGTIQVLGRIISFIKEGLKGEIKFGVDPMASITDETSNPSSHLGGTNVGGVGAGGEDFATSTGITSMSKPLAMVDRSYCWNERIEDVATVSWELVVLEKYLITEHVKKVTDVVSPGPGGNHDTHSDNDDDDDNDNDDAEEVKILISEVMTEAAQDISPVVNEIWNEIIVDILTTKCSTPLGAVKGVAATYRMTNRPPPTQASPFVATILRPLKEFVASFADKTPPQVGMAWKKKIVDTIAERYSTAVSELIETVQRTEEALKNRKVRRAAAGGMGDGEKVRLQLYLDQKSFAKSVEEVGIDALTVDGMQKLVTLTQAAEELYRKTLS